MKMMKKLLVACLALTLVACGGGETTTDDGSGSIKIGMIGPLEGDTSIYGIAVKNGADLAIKDYNAKNGTNFELVAYDSKGDSTEAVNAYNKLVDEDGAVAIVGATLSGESVAVATSSVSYGTPIISPSATVSDFTLVGDNIFRGCYTDPYQAKIAAEFSFNTLGARTVSILYNTGDDYSKGLMENYKATFEGLGGTVSIVEGYQAGDVDFNAQLTKIKAEDTDVLFVPNYYKDDALIAKQAKALGITSTLVGGDGWDGILDSIDDASAIEGAVFVNHYSPDNETVQELTDRYMDAYGIKANAFSVLSYDTTTCLLDAIVAAGSHDADAIVNALKASSFDGVLGHMEFNENGDPIKDLSYITIKDGQYVSYGK